MGLIDDVDVVLRDWQSDSLPLQLHPGDVGWFGRLGRDATEAALRTWRVDGEIAGVGLLDGPDTLRLTTAPALRSDADLAQRIAVDVVDPERGVLPAGRVAVEVPTGARLHDVLGEAGWSLDDPWTPLARSLTEPVEPHGLRLEVVTATSAPRWGAVLQSSFGSGPYDPARWERMAAAPAFASSRTLLALADDGSAAAAVTVWSAGPGRPGLIEPMGVHTDHRRRGFGRAICLAAAAALQELGSSSVQVCTPTANATGVATYEAAGFVTLPLRYDRLRPAA